jgi:methyl-accepting chemotaxis protein
VRLRIGRGVLEPVIDLIDERKQELESMLSGLLDRGIDVFDRHYDPIPNTDPAQFNTTWSEPLRVLLQTKMDNWYTQYKNQGINFCMPIDDHGFVAVNRTELSKPRTGNPEIDRAQSRVKYFAVDKQRVEANRTITDIALSTFTIINGQIVFSMAKPLMVKGRRWGTVNIGIMPSVFGIETDR